MADHHLQGKSFYATPPLMTSSIPRAGTPPMSTRQELNLSREEKESKKNKDNVLIKCDRLRLPGVLVSPSPSRTSRSFLLALVRSAFRFTTPVSATLVSPYIHSAMRGKKMTRFDTNQMPTLSLARIPRVLSPSSWVTRVPVLSSPLARV